MSQHRRAGRGFALGFMAVLVASLMLPMTALAAKPTQPRLGLHDEQLLAKARIEGRETVTILVAAKGGAARQAEAAITNAGGTIRYRDAALGYIRADVPTTKVVAIASNAAIQAVDLDETVPLPDPRPEGAAPTVDRAPPDANTPRANPFMPIQDTGAAAFLDEHPTWDGRGVTIGIVDSGVSLDHPSLNVTSTGERKIIDWVTGTDPLTDPDPTWINMSTQVSGASFTFQSVTYTAPAAGSYRIGRFNERDPRLSGVAEIGGDVNRDGNPAGSSGIFAVLWSTGSNTVWVDVNQNNDFADEAGMTDYKVNFDVGYFGTDRASTPVIDRVPFVVQTDGKNKFVNIGIVSGFHGSHVAGIAAGNSLFGGEMSGAAPGAKIVSSRACLFITGCTGHALLEGMIYVAKQANVDVINMSIGGLPALNDGNNSRCVVYDRLIDQEDVQMFFSIGNSGPGVNTAGDPGVCGKVMGMGAYLTDATMFADYGVNVGYPDNLHTFSSRGPREDGGFKPSAVAPGAAISTTPLWQQLPGIQHTPPLPPGYTLANGTSMASPQTAGVGALLVSAAKQAGVQHQPDQIRQALMSSARYLDPARFQAYDQGAGLIDVNAAWELLATNLTPVTITSSVEVDSVLSGVLATPGVGQGIYDREGVSVGESYTRTYTFVRSDGPGGSRTYNLTWVDNDGTFSTAGSITLPKGAARTLNVTVHPTTAGAHSAILQLDDPGTVGVDYQTMNTVIAALEFDRTANYTATVSDTIDRSQTKHFFFRVPEEATYFKVDMVGGGTAPGQIRFLRWDPTGIGIDSNAVSSCYNPPVSAGNCNLAPFTGAGQDPLSRAWLDPMPGVWEVSVDARRTSDADNAPFTITASILAASVSPNPDVIDTAAVGVPVARSYEITNELGSFTGRATGGGALGSAFIDRLAIAQDADQFHRVDVTTGSTSLRATIGNPGDSSADLDLFLLDCTGMTANPADPLNTCILRAQSADGDSEESVSRANPAAGPWIVWVNGFDTGPTGSTEFDYFDIFVNPAFGSVSVTDANALRAQGSSWTVPGSVTANAVPASGRVLFGRVNVVTDTNAIIGSGDVIVENVTGP
jgi:subtilisin family serine protease